MSRIDAAMAPNRAEAARPLHSARDAELQREEATRRGLAAANDPASDAPGADDLAASTARLQAVVEAASGRQLSFTMEKKGGGNATHMGLQIDEENKDTYITIRDQGTGEVIKQLPSEEVRELRNRIEALVGMFLNEQA